MSELIYGRHAVYESLRTGRRRIYRLWLEGEEMPAPARKGSSKGDIIRDIINLAEKSNVPIRTVKGGLFEKLARQNARSQGVALEVGDYPYVELNDCLAYAKEQGEPPLLLLLDHLHDPQNLGTLMRTAEAMGVHGLLIPERRSAQITPAVSNASSGAVEHLRVVQVTNLNRMISWIKKENIWVVGLEGSPQTPTLDQANLSGALAIVIGNEGSGLSRLTREKCDFLVRLPMYGQIESLNAAVAGSIVLYMARQVRG
ncbi:MAG: 23S rRNA (guanosine(2251)-2'-O)-methyltransferase RlmB [Chloroflexota bacterium]